MAGQDGGLPRGGAGGREGIAGHWESYPGLFSDCPSWADAMPRGTTNSRVTAGLKLGMLRRDAAGGKPCL